MTVETLSQKDKELIAVACAVSAGCQRCCDYHFKKVFEVGASLEEVSHSVQSATLAIHHADEMMQRKAYSLMDVSRPEVPLENKQSERMTALIQLGAAVASNCTPTIKEHLDVVKTSGATSGEIKLTIKLAKMVLGKASEFADRAISDALEDMRID